MSSEQQTQLLGEPKGVDVVTIERELTQLWKSALLSNGEGSGPAPVVRACALNFIVLSDDERRIDSLAEMVGEVTVEHPARIFLISANRRSGTPKLDAWISARCSLPVPGGKQVCCEQISLTADGSEAGKIPSIVTSLLVSDVPNVLLWKATADANDQVLQSLVQVVDRALIDSSEEAEPEHGMLAWHDLTRRHVAHTTFGDLAWTHLTAWRSVIANSFNPQEMRPLLSGIKSVAIEYSTTTSPRHSGLSQALLLVSWLSQKLEWTIIKTFQKNGTEEYTAKLRSGEQAINISIVPVASRKGSPGGIESVTIPTSAGVTLKFGTTGFKHCVRFSKEGGMSPSEEMLTVMSDRTESELVAQELEVVIRDAGYEAALKKFAELFKKVP